MGDEVVHEMHPQPHAALLVGGEEGVEDARQGLRLDPAAVVAKIDAQAVSRVPGDTDADHALLALPEAVLQ